MTKTKRTFTFFISLIFVSGIYAQNNADEILNRVSEKLQKAKDYSVQANIKVDMPLIRILPVDVKIYYKEKGKFKVESKSIALVPRQGFDQISMILAEDESYSAMIQGEEKLGETMTSIINVFPLSDTGEVIFAKFWVDPVQNVILKSQLTTKSNGTVLTEYVYGNQISYGLPDKMIFYVDVKKFKMPKNIGTPDNTEKNKRSGDDNKKGTIYITFSNYQINKGIPDSFFNDRK